MPLVQITNVYRHSPAVEAYLRRILANQEIIMSDTAQVLAELAAANASLDGIVEDIAALEALVAAGGTPDEVAAAVSALAARTAGINAQR